ncbi:MAG TPA: hypothetical protein VFY87_28590 [Geminicoccaceae bacterium]|nr:hypothetical protein [Geminicoccaceae bacterium]
MLELALADSDWRAAAFIATQVRLGRDPAYTLAQRVVEAQARAAAAPPPAPKAADAAPSLPCAPRLCDPTNPVVRRAAARLRDAVAAEAALAHEPAAPAAKPAAAPAPLPATRPRRLDGLAARRRGGTAAARPAEPADTSPRGLLRASAQGS